MVLTKHKTQSCTSALDAVDVMEGKVGHVCGAYGRDEDEAALGNPARHKKKHVSGRVCG